MKHWSLKIATALAYFTMVGVNFLAVTLPLAGRSTGEISDHYRNLFAPAGFTFSIWGVIYTLLLVYVIYQFAQTNNQFFTKTNQLFIVNALLNAMWIFAWHYDYILLSVIIMLGLLYTLIKIADVWGAGQLTARQRWLARVPFSVYFGWITVATIANITVLLVKLGWNGFGIPESVWTVAVLIIGALIGLRRMSVDRFFPYGLVLIWAYGGILVKHLSSGGFAAAYPSIIITATSCILAFAAATLYSLKPNN